jgi:hypothetical protein
MWMCPAMPAPAALPMFMPRLMPSGVVEFAQHGFHALRERHHFIGGFDRQLLQFVEVSVGDDHHVAGRVGIRVQDDEAMLAAIDD